MLPSNNFDISTPYTRRQYNYNTYRDLLDHIIEYLPKKAKWTIKMPIVAKEEFPVEAVSGSIKINNTRHRIKFYKNAKYIEITLVGTNISYIDLVPGHCVVQQQAVRYYMNKYNIKDATQLLYEISYPIHKTKKVLNHSFYCDRDFSRKMSTLTGRSVNFFRELLR